MEIKVNDKPTEIADGSSLEQLLQMLEVKSRGTAVAVNDKIAKREHWASIMLQPGDSVLVISAAYGG